MPGCGGWYASLLNDATGDVAKRLDALFPEEWTAEAAKDYEAELAAWKREGRRFAGTVEQLNGRQADLLEQLRPQHGKLQEAMPGHMDAIMEAYKNSTTTSLKHGDGRPLNREETLDFFKGVLVSGAKQVQEIEQMMERAHPNVLSFLLEQQISIMEASGAIHLEKNLKDLGLSGLFGKALEEALSTERALVAALKAEAPVRAWQRREPLKGLARWNDHCAFLAFNGDSKLDGTDKKFVKEMRAYLAAADKDGITKPVSSVGSRTEMYGSGAKRFGGSTYRWDYDGTYITASDSETAVGADLLDRRRGPPGRQGQGRPRPEVDHRLLSGAGQGHRQEPGQHRRRRLPHRPVRAARQRLPPRIIPSPDAPRSSWRPSRRGTGAKTIRPKRPDSPP